MNRRNFIKTTGIGMPALMLMPKSKPSFNLPLNVPSHITVKEIIVPDDYDSGWKLIRANSFHNSKHFLFSKSTKCDYKGTWIYLANKKDILWETWNAFLSRTRNFKYFYVFTSKKYKDRVGLLLSRYGDEKLQTHKKETI